MTLVTHEYRSPLQERLHAEHKARQARYGFEALKLRQQQELAARLKAKREEQCKKPAVIEQRKKPEAIVKLGLAPKKRQWAKLTAENVAYIRANPDRLTGKQLRDKFGVSESTISDVIRNKSWKEITVQNIAPRHPTICTREEVWQEIVAVAERHNVPVDSILGPSRIKAIALARREAIRSVAKVVDWQPGPGNWGSGKWTLARMTRLFQRDHTTILHALGRTKRARARGIA